MAKIGKFHHDSFVQTDIAAVDTNYNVARVHAHSLYSGTIFTGNAFADRIETILVRFKTIAGGAAAVTLRLCLDAAGDYAVVPDTTATISLGITTATTGCAAVKYDAPIRNVVGANDTLYLFVRLDAGTAVLDASCITWSE